MSNIFEYGRTFDLNTGKEIKKLTKVTKESNLKKIKKTLKKKIKKEDKGYDVSELNKMKDSDFSFYIKKNGKVVVCFGPYALGYGGWTKTFELAGKYK